ncbi:MAG: alpha-L-fucosidase [Planctomycetota bacterium]|nr:alpha-L-fucosidase [Planctomycetota bacterium]
MFSTIILFSTLTLAGFSAPIDGGEYEPSWESLAHHDTPAWFSDAKFGIFIHWGVYSVPAFCDTSTYSEWYQKWYDSNSHDGKVRKFHHRVYGEDFEYREFAPLFKAELYDPDEWAQIFRRSGAKYMVITSKHHDGFCLWPSNIASEVRGYPWNSVETGPKRDLLEDLFVACRKEGVRPGLYYSFMEWHNPLYSNDRPRYVNEVMIPQIQDIIQRYQPDVFWPDGEWDYPDKEWRSEEILEWIYENAANPDDIVVNDRWGKGLRGQVGDYSTTEYGNLGNSSGKGMRKQRPFEECRGIGHSFAFNRAENYDIYSSRTECIQMLIDLVSKGGNLLLDIGPDDDGTIPLIMVDRLLAMGRWLDVNGEAIYGTTRGALQKLTWGRSTTKGNHLYLHIYDWPANDKLTIEGLVTKIDRAVLLGDRIEGRNLSIDTSNGGFPVISLDDLHPDEHVSVIRLELSGPPVVDNAFRPDSNGVLHLHASRADIQGGTLRLETLDAPDLDDEPNLGYWTDTTSTASWPIKAIAGQKYQIEALCAVATSATGGTLSIQLGANRVTHEVNKETAGWNRFQWRELAQITAPGDETDLVLQAVEVGPVALINIRQVKLTPIDQE